MSNDKESWKERVDRFLNTGYAHLHASVATGVDAVNAGLAAAEQNTQKIQAPVRQAWQKASQVEQAVEKQLQVLYKRRGEIGPQVVAASAVTGGLLFMIRRRGILRFLAGSVVGGGLGYVTVYEPLPIKKIPELVKEQFQPSEKK